MQDNVLKMAYEGLKHLDDISSAVEKEQRKINRDKGEWTEEQAKSVLKTGEEIVIKSTEHGIPDRILTVEHAKKVMLQRHRVREKQINQCRNQIGQVLREFNCKLQGAITIDDQMYGQISRLRARDSNGVVTLTVGNEKIQVVIND